MQAAQSSVVRQRKARPESAGIEWRLATVHFYLKLAGKTVRWRTLGWR
jgi:hypothetical protein